MEADGTHTTVVPLGPAGCDAVAMGMTTTEQIDSAVEIYANITAQIKALEAERDRIKDAAMADIAGMTFPYLASNDYRVSMRPGRAAVDAAKLADELPDLYEAIAKPQVDVVKFDIAVDLMGLSPEVVRRYRKVGKPYITATKRKTKS